MNKKFNFTWKNILLLIVIYYVIGDVLLSVKMEINRKIRQYEAQQFEKEYLEYKKKNGFTY